MALYSEHVPRDPSAIDQRSTWDGAGTVSMVVMLLMIVVAAGLYFLYADSSPTLPTVAAPPVTQLSPSPAPAPAPATQPSTQTPTP